jgi:hypothetical protein
MLDYIIDSQAFMDFIFLVVVRISALQKHIVTLSAQLALRTPSHVVAFHFGHDSFVIRVCPLF